MKDHDRSGEYNLKCIEDQVMSFGCSNMALPWTPSQNGHLLPNRGMLDLTITTIDVLKTIQQ